MSAIGSPVEEGGGGEGKHPIVPKLNTSQQQQGEAHTHSSSSSSSSATTSATSLNRDATGGATGSATGGGEENKEGRISLAVEAWLGPSASGSSDAVSHSIKSSRRISMRSTKTRLGVAAGETAGDGGDFKEPHRSPRIRLLTTSEDPVRKGSKKGEKDLHLPSTAKKKKEYGGDRGKGKNSGWSETMQEGGGKAGSEKREGEDGDQPFFSNYRFGYDALTQQRG